MIAAIYMLFWAEWKVQVLSYSGSLHAKKNKKLQNWLGSFNNPEKAYYCRDN